MDLAVIKKLFIKVRLIYQIVISQSENFKKNNICLNEEDYSFASKKLIETRYLNRFNNPSFYGGIQTFTIHKFTGALKPLVLVTHEKNIGSSDYITIFKFLLKLNILILQQIKIFLKNEQ
jgi:hypothetical protein